MSIIYQKGRPYKEFKYKELLENELNVKLTSCPLVEDIIKAYQPNTRHKQNVVIH